MKQLLDHKECYIGLMWPSSLPSSTCIGPTVVTGIVQTYRVGADSMCEMG